LWRNSQGRDTARPAVAVQEFDFGGARRKQFHHGPEVAHVDTWIVATVKNGYQSARIG